MTRANYHWSRTAVLHVGVDPDACAQCGKELEALIAAALAAEAGEPREAG